MSVSKQNNGNVRRYSGAGTYQETEKYIIESIKYVGSTAGAVNIRETDTAGDIVYKAAGSADIWEEPCIRTNTELNIEVVSSAVCYVYIK